MNFLEYLSTYTTVSQEAAEFLKEKTVQKRMPKGQLLHSEGDVCNRLWYIEEGVIRWYFLNDDGKDITDSFSTEHSFVTAFDSFFQRKPSQFFIETLEDCLMTQIEYQHLEESLTNFPELEQITRFVLIEIIEQALDKNASLRFKKASERYRFITEKHPDLLQRVPLGHIASYIGISQETLSRIRARK